MNISSEAIVLSSIKYGDNDLITRLYLRSSGLRSYLLRGILKSKKGKLRASLFQPLTLLDVNAIHKDKGTLERLKEAKRSIPYKTIHVNILKNAMVFFLAETVENSVKEEESNPALFDYIKASLLWLDLHSEIGNFHISFIVNLTKFLGFYPDSTSKDKTYFNTMTGTFQDEYEGGHTKRGPEIESFKHFLGTNFDASNQIKLTRKTRNDILEMLLIYFELHLHGFKKPKSLRVLNEIFR